jgi:hypothetical protein
MTYPYSSYSQSEFSPARNAVAVTPSDSENLATSAKALWVGQIGDVSVDTVGGQTAVVFKNCLGVLPVTAVRVRATGTTATDIVALY